MTDIYIPPTAPPPDIVKRPYLELSEKEIAELRKSAIADMLKHGFSTVDELIDYYDRKRGY